MSYARYKSGCRMGLRCHNEIKTFNVKVTRHHRLNTYCGITGEWMFSPFFIALQHSDAQYWGYRQKATEQKATGQKATDKRPQDRRPLRQKARGQKATERNVKMLCQDVLERLRVVLKTVEQIVLSSVLVCRSSLLVVYLSPVLVNCSTTATVCIGQDSPC